jgi:hypothetical protein
MRKKPGINHRKLDKLERKLEGRKECKQVEVIIITDRDDGDTVFEFNKKGLKMIKNMGTIEMHSHGSMGIGNSYSIKGWRVKSKYIRTRVSVTIKDEDGHSNNVEINDKITEKFWKNANKIRKVVEERREMMK